ncbi:MAG: YgiQ family radical SAM protein [Planctomycetota bacterium]|nr:YgiQ family radical SAM protein [Planctomycetota bacterium]
MDHDDQRHGVDFVLVSGDAYVDHPSFANAVIGRLMEARGYRVAILAQPEWRSIDAFRTFGAPRIAWLVSAGNLDSHLNHYTAHKRPRSDDQYSPGGKAGLRPDGATIVYSQRCREAYKDVPIIAGGVEVSMRRLAHVDYWAEKVKRSLLLDSRCDIAVYGMGEKALVEIAERLAQGQAISEIHDVPGTAYAIGKFGRPHFIEESDWEQGVSWSDQHRCDPKDVLELPSFDLIRGEDDESKQLFARAQHLFHREQNPDSAPILVQKHADHTVVVNRPMIALTTEELDAVFSLPYTKAPHPIYGEQKIPAYETVKFSINIMRGCFGGCTFCAITEHQGRAVSSRSEESVLREVEQLKELDGYKGVISDLGGPTANMYRMRCTRPEIEARCRRPSCVHPTVCKLLGTDHGPVKKLMKKVRESDGVKMVHVASGVRMDLANLDQEYIDDLAAHHVGGHLKVAPEHIDEETLRLMKKPGMASYTEFEKRFEKASERAGKEQYLVPYFVSSHPGCEQDAAVRIAEFLEARHLKPQQVQDFIPTPGTPATCMWWTGIDPTRMKNVFVEKKMRNKRKQRAMLQWWKPENRLLVREMLRESGRSDLIGDHEGALVSASEPGKERNAGSRLGRRKRHRRTPR